MLCEYNTIERSPQPVQQVMTDQIRLFKNLIDNVIKLIKRNSVAIYNNRTIFISTAK